MISFGECISEFKQSGHMMIIDNEVTSSDETCEDRSAQSLNVTSGYLLIREQMDLINEIPSLDNLCLDSYRNNRRPSRDEAQAATYLEPYLNLFYCWDLPTFNSNLAFLELAKG